MCTQDYLKTNEAKYKSIFAEKNVLQASITTLEKEKTALETEKTKVSKELATATANLAQAEVDKKNLISMIQSNKDYIKNNCTSVRDKNKLDCKRSAESLKQHEANLKKLTPIIP